MSPGLSLSISNLKSYLVIILLFQAKAGKLRTANQRTVVETCQQLRAALTGVRTQSGALSHYGKPAGVLHAGRIGDAGPDQARPREIWEEFLTGGNLLKDSYLLRLSFFFN